MNDFVYAQLYNSEIKDRLLVNEEKLENRRKQASFVNVNRRFHTK